MLSDYLCSKLNIRTKPGIYCPKIFNSLSKVKPITFLQLAFQAFFSISSFQINSIFKYNLSILLCALDRKRLTFGHSIAIYSNLLNSYLKIRSISSKWSVIKLISCFGTLKSVFSMSGMYFIS